VSGTAFKMFAGSPAQVEDDLNIWVESLPPRTKIRRTQLAASGPGPVPPGMFSVGGDRVYALVNYELPEVG
jgi:hypothetical protein